MQTISRAEEQVMAALWACGGAATRREIGAKLGSAAQKSGWADSTLLNFLLRLEKKGFVKSEKQGNKNSYTPLVRRATYGAAQTAELLQTLYAGDLRQMMADLADSGRLSNNRMEQLARWLDARVVEHPEYDYD